MTQTAACRTLVEFPARLADRARAAEEAAQRPVKTWSRRIVADVVIVLLAAATAAGGGLGLLAAGAAGLVDVAAGVAIAHALPAAGVLALVVGLAGNRRSGRDLTRLAGSGAGTAALACSLAALLDPALRTGIVPWEAIAAWAGAAILAAAIAGAVLANLLRRPRFARHLRSNIAVYGASAAARRLPPRVTEDIAVLHFTASWSKLPFMTLLRAQRGDHPIVLVEHTYTRSFEQCCVPQPRRFRSMLRLAYSLVDVVVAVSHGQAAWLQEAGLAPPEKIVVIPASVDCAGLHGIPLPGRREARMLRLAAYGRYHEQKGFDVLLDAMRLLPAGTAELTLAGYGPDQAALEASALGLSGVKIGGMVESLSAFLAACDAVVIPSRWEAFGLVGLEARAAGRPIVATGVDGLAEQVIASGGILAATASAPEVAAAIIRLQGLELARAGRAARHSAAEHHGRHLSGWTGLLGRLEPRPRRSFQPVAALLASRQSGLQAATGLNGS